MLMRGTDKTLIGTGNAWYLSYKPMYNMNEIRNVSRNIDSTNKTDQQHNWEMRLQDQENFIVLVYYTCKERVKTGCHKQIQNSKTTFKTAK